MTTNDLGSSFVMRIIWRGGERGASSGQRGDFNVVMNQ